VDEERNAEHLSVEIDLLVGQMEVQENFLVYLDFPMLMNNRMMMIELVHHYHVKMGLLYDIIRWMVDEERRALVIYFVNR
jgi:hypothetical protein